MFRAVRKNPTSDMIERKVHLADPWYQLIIKMLNPIAHEFNGKRILEVGCGFGGFCVHVAGEGANVIGLDVSSRSIHSAKDLAKQLEVQRQVDFIIGDAQFLPFKDQTNEIVVCSETLEHVTNYERALCELVRVTHSSGYLCITVPNLLSTSFFEYVVLLLIGQPQYAKNQVCLEKEHIFHIFKLRELFCRKDLKVIKIRSTDFLHLPPRVRRALRISQGLKNISDRIENYFEAHDLPLKFFGANIGVLARKE
jgi:2-polyprenyl-3-methyl-5-hydroxy-6-metoxy-1,4-benzoquinol methylase